MVSVLIVIGLAVVARNPSAVAQTQSCVPDLVSPLDMEIMDPGFQDRNFAWEFRIRADVGW